jgi:hypothetical protein
MACGPCWIDLGILECEYESYRHLCFLTDCKGDFSEASLISATPTREREMLHLGYRSSISYPSNTKTVSQAQPHFPTYVFLVVPQEESRELTGRSYSSASSMISASR